MSIFMLLSRPTIIALWVQRAASLSPANPSTAFRPGTHACDSPADIILAPYERIRSHALGGRSSRPG